mmetsp:Transcript_33094/g.72079  ORF Transcript_33094/g.72079 Transcript_33094/m.72079 type:complete len:437 (+) Transcript_33094:41-1351(+)
MVDVSEGEPFVPWLSTIARTIERNPVRATMMKIGEGKGNCISLAAGKPSVEVFPPAVREAVGDEMASYGNHLAVGCAELKSWARSFVDEFCCPAGGWASRDVLITSGTTDGITKALMLLTDPGDVILADEFTYPAIRVTGLALGRRLVGIPMGSGGMLPDALAAALDQLEGSARVLYLTTHGQNPTGLTMSVDRQAELYRVARRYGLTIIEDDSYFALNLASRDPGAPLTPDCMSGTANFPSCLLSIDVDGRVVRLDSTSKMLAPGFRLGWVTAPKALLEKWALVAEVFTWSVSAFEQKALLNLLQDWGPEGLNLQLQRLQFTYARKRDFLVAACERHLQGLCRWHVPDFGMFVWLEVLGDFDTLIMNDKIIENYGVGMVPGAVFRAVKDDDTPCAFFRLSFSLLEEETANTAMERLRTALLTARSDAAGRDQRMT